MNEGEEIQVPDIYPTSILSALQIVDTVWNPLSNVQYVYNGKEGVTDSSGFIEERNFNPDGCTFQVTKNDEDLPEEHYDTELHSWFKEIICSLKGISSIEDKNKGGGGPIGKRDTRSTFVNHIQSVLNYLGYDLGTTGPKNDGVDGIFGDTTEISVKGFQGLHRDDFTGQFLSVDGKVGPNTLYAMAREMLKRGIIKEYLVSGTVQGNHVTAWVSRRQILGTVDLGQIFNQIKSCSEEDGFPIPETLTLRIVADDSEKVFQNCFEIFIVGDPSDIEHVNYQLVSEDGEYNITKSGKEVETSDGGEKVLRFPMLQPNTKYSLFQIIESEDTIVIFENEPYESLIIENSEAISDEDVFEEESTTEETGSESLEGADFFALENSEFEDKEWYEPDPYQENSEIAET